MKAVMTSVVLLGAFASGCAFGRHSLPDEFEVRAIGTYKWFPFPFAEAGMYYDFIGIGWLVHDERTDEVALSHQGRDLAVAAHQGSDGWKLTVSGRNMVAKEGWSLGGSNSCMLAGTTRQANPQPSAQRPGRMLHAGNAAPELARRNGLPL